MVVDHRAGPADALLFYADAVLMLALDERGGLAAGAVDLLDAGFTGRRAEIHQAVGMVSVQLGVSLTDALVALRARAYAEGRAIAQVAADVIARRLSFAPPGFCLPGSGGPVREAAAAPADDAAAPADDPVGDDEREEGR